MMLAAAIFVYVGIAIGLALFLFESDKSSNKRPHAGASFMVGAVWPFLIIAVPVALLLQRLDEKTP